MSDSEYEMETVEKSKTPKKRVCSEKQIEHLRKIQPKATEAKKKNKEILPINKHIRGDIRYPNDKVRATTVSNGEFLWDTTDILSAYQIDL